MNARSIARFGLAFNACFERYMFVFIPASLVSGFLLSPFLFDLTFLVPFLFAYLTFVMAMGCGWEQMKSAFRTPAPLALTFALAHVAAPWIAYETGVLLFGPNSPYVVGLVLFTAIPLGVSSVIWVSMSGGGVPLTLALIVLDSALSPFVVPAIVSFYFGTDIAFDRIGVMKDLLLIVVAPTAFGVLVNELSKGRAKPWSAPVTAPTSKLVFAAVVMINAAAIAPHVLALKRDMLLLVPVVIVLVAVCYALGFVGALPLKNAQHTIALTYSSGMRNISLGIVIALGHFGPHAAVPVVMSILIQQPMATLHHWLLERYMRRKRIRPSGGVPSAAIRE